MSVPKRFHGSTIVCLASGPSLTVEDVAAVQGKAPVIAVNDTYRLAPWAEALYATDAQWWKHHREAVKGFAGDKWSLAQPNWGNLHSSMPEVGLLVNAGCDGLETEPSGIRHGQNSGYAAINLAVHYGAKRIVLLGYDMQPDGRKQHFFGDHAWRRGVALPYASFLRAYDTLVQPLKALGVEVVNCSRRTALTCFPRAPLYKSLEPIGVLS